MPWAYIRTLLSGEGGGAFIKTITLLDQYVNALPAVVHSTGATYLVTIHRIFLTINI